MLQVSSHKIDPKHDCIKAVFCVRNEKFRLPFFLNYYRGLGVREFFAIDNDSSDGTQNYLLDQPDVHVFHTSQSYKSSNAGRDWTSKIANQYCIDKWCLTLDVDEFFIFPFVEYIDLEKLTAYLDVHNYEAVFSVFLDFYSKLPLSETRYSQGASPFQICRYFDKPDSYTCYEREIFPHIEIKGGPRQRVFWPNQGPRVGPSMRKLVLVKWRKGFAYTHSTHSCTHVKLADITGAVAHFKFLSHFAQYAKSEVKRNTRIANSIDWKVYDKVLDQNDVCFYEKGVSVEYENSKTLLDAKIVSASRGYVDYCFHGLNSNVASANPVLRSSNCSDLNFDSIKPALKAFSDRAQVEYDQVIRLWSAISMFGGQFQTDAVDTQMLIRFDKDVSMAASSSIWRFSYPMRKLASKLGLTDQRTLTEENFYNQNLHARFTFTYKSIWWDLLGPLRVVEKLVRRIQRKSN